MKKKKLSVVGIGFYLNKYLINYQYNINDDCAIWSQEMEWKTVLTGEGGVFAADKRKRNVTVYGFVHSPIVGEKFPHGKLFKANIL